MTSINWSAVNTVNDWLATPNTASDGWFWMAMLYTLVGILTLSMIQFGIETALVVALLIGILGGILLVYMGLMNITWLFVLIGGEIVMIVYLMVTSPKNQ